MIIKDSVFAQAGQQESTRTEADFRTGMVPNTVAMAEDVNTYGNWSDRDLKVVCDEIVNALKSYGITPNDSYDADKSTQLRDMLLTKLNAGTQLTGIVRDTFTVAPTLTGDTISFTKFDVMFNNAIYYGSTQSQMKRVTIATQTLTATSWPDGVNYIYATSAGALAHQTTPVLGADGATKCMLGSVFVIGGKFQAGSWKFQPWLMQTSIERRQIPTAGRKGGIITPVSGLAIRMGAVELLEEGINFGVSPNTPSIMSIEAKSPFTFKLLYPAYNPSDVAYTDLAYASTHIYNTTSGAMDDISALTGSYICLVPCIAPTGQTLMVPAMSTKTGEKYAAVFETIEQARQAVYGLQYQTGNTTSRCIFLGQTLIVQIGLSDVTDPTQFATEGIVPAALSGFTDASGQTGGGTGKYVPMSSYTWPVQPAITFQNNAVNVVEGSPTTQVVISAPTPVSDQVNQAEIHYTHTSTSLGLSFATNIYWWGASPSFVAGLTYNIIIEYINGKWRAGYLSMAA